MPWSAWPTPCAAATASCRRCRSPPKSGAADVGRVSPGGREAGYGLPYDVAFQNMLRRNPSEDLSLVVTAMELHIEMGGNLSEILDNIASIIRDRVRIQGQIRALTAQQRLSAIILTGLPFVVVGCPIYSSIRITSRSCG